MALHGKNFIGGQISARGSDTFQAVNPATAAPLAPPFYEAREDEIARAVELADLAFQERRWGDPLQNAALLEKIADEVDGLGERLIERAGAETALPATRLKMELARTVAQLRMFAGVAREGSWVDARIDRGDPARRPMAKPDVRRMLVPLGTVAVFGASNFPLAFSVAGGDTASALAAGCPVVVKAHPSHPGTSELVARAIQSALAATGMPEDWFSMVHGVDPALSILLVQLPAVRAVAFTGSYKAGRAIWEAANQRPSPIPVFAEMGSTNPVFLLPGALAIAAEKTARGLHQSLTLGAGQFCTNPGFVIALESPHLDRFIHELTSLVRQTPPATMLNERILLAYRAAVERLAATQGVKTAATSSAEAAQERTEAATALFTTGAETFIGSPDLRQEVFGPATLVVQCRTMDEMLDVAASLEGQLTATVHATEMELSANEELLWILRNKAGRVVVGGFPTGVEVCGAMHHGGPFPATSDERSTSVGTAAILRFARPICFQDLSDRFLPPELRDQNIRGIWRTVDGVRTTEDTPHAASKGGLGIGEKSP
jgi:NADP-dependent aldehyde dehydrogenase